IPDQVSTVTGKPVASAIKNVLALWVDGKMKNASGSQAVAGSGPMKRRTGRIQYPTARDQPMAMPTRNPALPPSATPPASSSSDAKMLSLSRAQSSIITSRIACGGGKKGSGSRPYFAVAASQARKNSASASNHGADRRNRRNVPEPMPAKLMQATATAHAAKMAE